MSVSIHMNGKNVADAKSGLSQHMERADEKSGELALLYSESNINPELSKYNIALKSFQKNPMKEIKEDFEEINIKRKSNGKRKAQKNKGVFLTSTLQLGDDSLEKLGWLHDDRYLQAFDEGWSKKRIKEENFPKWLPVDEQSDDAINNIELVYSDMLYSVEQQPERYGVVKGAFLHFDEGSPHVDMVQNCLDTNDLDFEHSGALHFLHGVKGVARPGAKLSESQDHLMDYSRFGKEVIDSFDLKRGESGSNKKDLIKNLRTVEAVIDAKEMTLDAERKQLEIEKRVFENRKEEFEAEKENFEEKEKPQIISDLTESLTKTLTPMVKAELTRTLEPKLKAELSETYKKDYSRKASAHFDKKHKLLYDEEMAKERAKDKLRIEQFEAQAVADVASSQAKAREVSDSNMAIIDLVESDKFKRSVPYADRSAIIKLAFDGSNIYADMAAESNRRKVMRRKAIESKNADDLEL